MKSIAYMKESTPVTDFNDLDEEEPIYSDGSCGLCQHEAFRVDHRIWGGGVYVDPPSDCHCECHVAFRITHKGRLRAS